MNRDQNQLKSDLKFGKEMEPTVIKIIERHFGTKITRTSNNYERYDCEDNERRFEIKCRRVSSNAYIDTMIGLNKRQAKRIGKALVFVFVYTDKVCIIEYDEERFASYPVKMVEAVRKNGYVYSMENYYIPMTDLVTIDANEEEQNEMKEIRRRNPEPVSRRAIPRGVCLL